MPIREYPKATSATNYSGATELLITSQWSEVYTETGISTGAALLMSGRGKHSIFLVESDSIPAATTAGIELYPTRQLIIDGGALGLWARTPEGVNSLAIIQEDI